MEKYQETAGDPFAQPVQVYSNVENGFGIFGGCFIEILVFDVSIIEIQYKGTTGLLSLSNP
ncbi:MAG: DUF4249 family protein [Crocinitomicaceae bacterium]|nr:DUF4249 family protein [Crocinitomicaceae bacterium]